MSVNEKARVNENEAALVFRPQGGPLVLGNYNDVCLKCSDNRRVLDSEEVEE